jgi:hypothetical protein
LKGLQLAMMGATETGVIPREGVESSKA